MLQFKNRIFLPPMAKEACVAGQPKVELVDYYAQQAQQGFGLIILEHAYVLASGQASPGQLSIAADYNAEILSQIRQAVQAAGAKVIMQINHSGRKTKVALPEKLGPSTEEADQVRALTVAEIQAIVQAFVAAAKRVKALGFDGVEVHSAHGYLLNQFYSPLVNKRTDAYGGSLEQRLRLHLEILSAIRAELGDFPLFLRLGACDFLPDGNDLATAIEAAKLLAPKLDYLDISGGIAGYPVHETGGLSYFAETSKAIKQAVKIPVLTAGGIKNRAAAEAVVQAGIADLAGIGRASLAPNFKLFSN